MAQQSVDNRRHPSLVGFIALILAVHLLVASLAFGVVALVGALPLRAAFIVGAILFASGGPVTALVTGSLARGCQWDQGLISTQVACSRAGYIYGAFAGAIIGSHFGKLPGGIAGGLALFLLGRLAGNRLGGILWARLNAPK